MKTDEKIVSAARKPRYKLRSLPKAVSKEDADSEFGLENYAPIEYIENDYKNNADGTVSDQATGLMWDQVGSEERLLYEEAIAYINILNSKMFAGYSDWRLPTVDELMSLLISGFHGNFNISSLDSVFGSKLQACWSADKLPPYSIWGICYAFGGAAWRGFDDVIYVRAVRSCQ